MFEEVGIFYGVLVIMLYVVALMDMVNIFLVFKKDTASRKEYCTYGIKYTKVITGLLFAALLIAVILLHPFSLYVLWLHIILIILLAVAEGAGLILKIKFGGKR